MSVNLGTAVGAYRAMLDRAGYANPRDAAIIGGVRRIPEVRERTCAVLRTLDS